MATRLKAALPPTLSIGLLAFLASEVALNFTFHWVTVENGVFGAYGVPQNVHLILPALFVSLGGLYFLLGVAGGGRRDRELGEHLAEVVERDYVVAVLVGVEQLSNVVAAPG
jgi:hypothetical protein